MMQEIIATNEIKTRKKDHTSFRYVYAYLSAI